MKAKTVSDIVAMLVVLPIWYYLLYQVLVRVNASELMFFLFWVYLPAGVVTGLISKIAADDK